MTKNLCKTLTVKELIAALQKMPPDYPVQSYTDGPALGVTEVSAYDGGGYHYVCLMATGKPPRPSRQE